MYGPTEDIGMIKSVQANTYNSTFNSRGENIINVGAGTGNYKVGELVFNGPTLFSSSATAFVKNWVPASNALFVEETSGYFTAGTNLTGVISHASHQINSFALNNNKLTNLVVTPNPPTANVANDSYGFIETLREYPQIL
jgi:hypothetical protein